MTIKTNRYLTSRVRADRVRAGHVLYHGGTVKSVRHNGDGTVTIEAHGLTLLSYRGSRLLTHYPNLAL